MKVELGSLFIQRVNNDKRCSDTGRRLRRNTQSLGKQDTAQTLTVHLLVQREAA